MEIQSYTYSESSPAPTQSLNDYLLDTAAGTIDNTFSLRNIRVLIMLFALGKWYKTKLKFYW